MQRSVLLLSGGLDSVCAWLLLGSPAHVYFDLGVEYNGAERAHLEKLFETTGDHLNVATIPALGKYANPANGYIPFRNLFLLMYAALSADEIIIAQVLEYQKDKNLRFYRKVSKLLSFLAGRKIRISAPFSHLTKTKLVARCIEEYWPVEFIAQNSFSCLKNSDRHCGVCSSCCNRFIALYNNGYYEEHETKFSWEQWRRNLKHFENHGHIPSIRYMVGRGVELLQFYRKWKRDH